MASAEQIFEQMVNAGEQAFGEGWGAVKTYAPAEFRKLAVQIEEIARNVARYKIDPREGYSEETGKLLLRMQRTASEGVLVATSRLTMIAVQNAMDAMYDVLREAFKGIVDSIL